MLPGVGVQYHRLLLAVVADHHRKVPLRPPVEAQILHHQHGVAGRYFGDNGLYLRTKWVNHQAVGSCPRHHFNLQGTLPAGQVNQVFQCVRIGGQPLSVEHGGQ